MHKILNDPKAWNLWIVQQCKKKKVDVWKRRLKFAWPAHLSSVIWLFDLTSQIRFQEIDFNFVYNSPTNISSIANPHDKSLDHFTMCYTLSHFQTQFVFFLSFFRFFFLFLYLIVFPFSIFFSSFDMTPSISDTHTHTHTHDSPQTISLPLVNRPPIVSFKLTYIPFSL